MQQIRNFAEARTVLETYNWRRMSRHAYNLDYITRLLDFLGNPQDTMRVIHVAGTSGKTSTSYYIAALLQAAGARVGLTVSPHAIEINDRVQINGVPLAEKEFCAELAQFLDLVAQSGVEPTYFELFIAFAFWEFHRQRLEYAVVEVGVGGLLDGTNVAQAPNKVCVITDIGMDHMHLLGDTLSEIAAQKAGIIHLHNTVFCYEQSHAIMSQIEQRARQKQADLHRLSPAEATTAPSDLPLFQQHNFALARETVRFVAARDGLNLTPKVPQAASKIVIPARMEMIQRGDKMLILDGAHNQQKLHVLMQSIAARFPNEPMVALISFAASAVADDRTQGGLKELKPYVHSLLTTSFGGPQDEPHHGIDADELADIASDVGFGWVAAVPNPEAAFHALLQRPEKVLLVTGSFYLLNHIRPLL